jgi:transmembrane sensor
MANFNEELIIKYLENTFSDEEELLLIEWLKESEENRNIFLTCKKIYNLRNIKHYSNPAHLENALHNFDLRTQSLMKQQHAGLILRYTRYAAILFLILALPVLFWFIVREKPVQYATVTMDSYEPVKTVILPDGTKVWVNNESTLTYPLKFNKAERPVTLAGEAYFEVRTDSLHPFIVKTNDIQVRVYGTSFDVNTNTSDNTAITTLVSGRVSIRDAGGNNVAMLTPGQLASFNYQTRKVDLHQVNTDVYTLWRKGLIVFDKASLNDITAKIEQFYNVNITVNAKNPLQNKINFVFYKSQPLDTVMEMLKFVVPINFKKYNDQVYINVR